MPSFSQDWKSTLSSANIRMPPLSMKGLHASTMPKPS